MNRATDRPLRPISVIALAVLGYGYVAGILIGLILAMISVLLVAPSAATIGWVVLPLGAVAVVVLRALWIRLPDPDGIRIRPADAPELFRLLGALRRELRAPRIHEVWIDGTVNAAVG